MPRAVVTASEWLERAGDWVGQHQDERRDPSGSDDLSGVGFSLPYSGF